LILELADTYPERMDVSSDAEKRLQKAEERAAQLEQKYMEGLKRIEGSTGMGHD
jgi:hypothetical protein